MTDKQIKNMAKAQTTEKKADALPERLYFTTGIDVLDLVVGGGESSGFGMGYLSGSVIRDWGGSSSSKTFKACHIIAANHYKFKDKFKWCYQDIEHGNTIDTKTLYGFDIKAGSFKGPREVRTVEDWFYDMYKFAESLKSDECGMYLLDSLDSTSSEANEERKEERISIMDKGKTLENGTFGMNSQKFLSQEMFRGLQADIEKKKMLVYIISQARDNVGAIGNAPKLRVNGGQAVRFAESVRIQSKATNKDEDKGVPVSVQVWCKAEKTRHPKPFRTCQYTVRFDYGIDNIASSIDYLYDLRTDLGTLTGRADAVSWGSAEPVTDTTIEDFLEKNGVFDACVQDLRKRFNVKNIKKWIAEKPELNVLFEERFGKTMSRDELINLVEAEHLQKELRRRVVQKWDDFEASIATQRPRQFSYVEE